MECNARQLDNGKCGLTGEGCIGKVCMYHEPDQTNADRIRAMSDEELCEFLMRDDVCDQKMNPDCADCEKCVLDWLQQAAEVE